MYRGIHSASFAPMRLARASSLSTLSLVFWAHLQGRRSLVEQETSCVDKSVPALARSPVLVGREALLPMPLLTLNLVSDGLDATKLMVSC
jgi:hypothetical protein